MLQKDADVLFHQVVVHLRTLTCFAEGYHFTERGTNLVVHSSWSGSGGREVKTRRKLNVIRTVQRKL